MTTTEEDNTATEDINDEEDSKQQGEDVNNDGNMMSVSHFGSIVQPCAILAQFFPTTSGVRFYG